MSTRRESIENLIGPNFRATNVNAGLWFDKFISDARKSRSSDETPAKAQLVQDVANTVGEPAVYGAFYEKRLEALRNIAMCRKATVDNRLVIGLGSESVLETNISLHRVFGTPIIPGSGIKGLVSHFLDQYGGSDWRMESDNHTVVCGNQENAGFITFHDALYVPGSGFGGRALHVDVMTPHHSDYYGNKGKPPADWDSPTPVAFLSATGQFLFAISGPPEWVNIIFKVLEFALQFEGVGAKTSSGYGRMHFVGGFILSDAQIEAKQTEKFDGLFAEMEKLLSKDKEIKKAAKRKLKEFTRTLNSENEGHKDLAGQISKKADDLEIKRELTETDPDWYKPIRIILGE